MTIKEPKIPGYDVVEMDDKGKRDDIFDQMRASDDPLERKSVKFSGSRPVETGVLGEIAGKFIQYSAKGKGGKINLGRPQFRPAFVSTWSIATPRG